MAVKRGKKMPLLRFQHRIGKKKFKICFPFRPAELTRVLRTQDSYQLKINHRLPFTLNTLKSSHGKIA